MTTKTRTTTTQAKRTKIQAMTPFLMYSDGGADAVKHYVSIFRGAKIRSMNVSDGKDGGKKGQLMGATFEIGGVTLSAYDGGPSFKFSEGISLMVTVKTQKEIDDVSAALTKGGEQGACGWLTDRWGVSWQVVPERLMELLGDKDPQRAGRAVQAMLRMKKLDIKKLDAAADGR